MTLDEFEHAEGEEGRLYELSRGVITVIDVPQPEHLAQLNAIRRQVFPYWDAHPNRIHTIATSGECKILLAGLGSERHPDLAIYLASPPAHRGVADIWSVWIPEIVIEIVSPSSVHRDYVEKREEYLQFGVREYWIIDAEKQQMLVLRRSRGKWSERAVKPDEPYQCGLLPGFALDLAAVFRAAGEA
ncbi:MAG: Uma2 family endonuclease [Planctomycetaceae bacterium]